MSRLKFLLIPLLAVGALGSLTGCVAYPAYGGGYYGGPSAEVIVPAPVYRPYYGGGWGHGHWR
jgi:hypothetical protein